MARRTAILLLLMALMPAAAHAQPAASFPTATTIDALTRYPNFYHLKAVLVQGQLTLKDGQARLLPPGGAERGVDLLVRGAPPAEGLVEVRGQFWDVGRLSQDDPHAGALDLPAFVHARIGDRWPAHGEMLVINTASVLPAAPPSPRPSLRQLSLDPDHYEGQSVTVSGQFGGRNLFGDLPQSPRASRTDFVLRNAGGAVWVSGMPPKGKGFELDPSSKMDTDQWLRVDGVVHHGEGLVWIEAKTIGRTTPQAVAQEPKEEPPAVLPAPPPEVVFSLPAQDETDVPATTTVKFQTSRDLDPATLEKHVLVSYLGQAADAPPIAFKAAFDRTNRVLELKFDQPLERFRTVKIELQDAIKGTDGQPLKPFTLTFSIGG